MSADLFGLAATEDLGIGQNPLILKNIVDVMSPMIYPQGYSSGTYNIACPVCNPNDLIEATMRDWKKAAVGGTAELRPWIQAYNWHRPHVRARPGEGAGERCAGPHRSRVPAVEPEGHVLGRHAEVPHRPVTGAEDRARELGLLIPDFHADGYYGGDFGSMKSHHVVNRVLYLSGHVPEGPDGPVAPRPAGPRRDDRTGLRRGAADGAQLPGRDPLCRRLPRPRPLPGAEPLLRGRLRPTSPTSTSCSSGCSDLLRDVFGPDAGTWWARDDRRPEPRARPLLRVLARGRARNRPCLTGSPTPAAAHAIATPHAGASEVGDTIFRRGGNAVDAAVAAAAALTVCYPHMCAVGGDIIALVATPDGAVRVVNGSGAAPAGASAERLAAEYGEMPLRGAHSVTVPGAVAAWETLLEIGGTGRFADLLEPAAKMAEEGVAVTPSLAKSLLDEERRGAIEADEGMNAVFRPQGRVLTTGDLLVQPALARTLRALQANGAAALYRGPVGAAITSRLQGLSSPMTADDLAAHVTEVTEPLVGVFGDEEVLTAPPNSQGLLLLEILAAAARLGDVDLLGADADLLAELFRLTTIDRDRHLADPRFAGVPVDELLSARHAAELAGAALGRRTAGGVPSPPPAPKGTGDTVAVVAADAAGNAVVIIQSVFYEFGSGILDPTTGVILHNRGAYFSVDPASPNVIGGGRRPAHTLMPVLVRRDGRIVGLHGTMGGSAQAQIHAQLILRTARGEGARRRGRRAAVRRRRPRGRRARRHDPGRGPLRRRGARGVGDGRVRGAGARRLRRGGRARADDPDRRRGRLPGGDRSAQRRRGARRLERYANPEQPAATLRPGVSTPAVRARSHASAWFDVTTGRPEQLPRAARPRRASAGRCTR